MSVDEEKSRERGEREDIADYFELAMPTESSDRSWWWWGAVGGRGGVGMGIGHTILKNSYNYPSVQ